MIVEGGAAKVTPVLLPGNMCDARLWRGGDEVIIATLARHFAQAPCNADLTRDDSIAQMAARTLAAVDGPLLPIGFSMGAIVALEMARQAPERVAGLVLLGYNATADLPERAAHRPVQQAEVRAGGLERVLVEELKPNYLAAERRRDLALLELLRDMGMTLGAEVFLRQSEALRRRDDRVAALSALPGPVLYGCGAEDAMCPPHWHQRWQQATPGAQLAIVAGAGHMLPLEQPQALAQVLDSWLTAKDWA